MRPPRRAPRQRRAALGRLVPVVVLVVAAFLATLGAAGSPGGPGSSSRGLARATAAGVPQGAEVPSTGAGAVGGVWEQLPGSAPAARVATSMAYDPLVNGSLLFGGHRPPPLGADVNDTWLLTSAGWANLSSSIGASPPALGGTAMAFDPTIGGMLLFGGANTNGTCFNQTWVFTGGRWHLLTTAHAPSPRQGVAFAWDSSGNRVVLMGGVNATGGFLGDTWTFNGTDWASLAATGAVPGARSYAEFADDPAAGGLLLFGGRQDVASVPFNDTLLLRGATWSPVASGPTPAGRAGEELVDDPAVGGILMFGGFNGSGGQNLYYNQTWLFDGGRWIDLARPVEPLGRNSGGIAYDTLTESVVMFGGAGTDADLGDTWVYDNVSVSATVASRSGPAPFTLNGTSNASGGWPPYAFTWSLPGNVVVDQATVRYVLSSPGNYTVRVSARDALGASGGPGIAFAITVKAVPVNPLAINITAAPSGGSAPLQVRWSANVTGGYPPYVVRWNFTNAEFLGVVATMEYPSPGTFPVNVTATDAVGEHVSRVVEFVVFAPSVKSASAGCFGPFLSGTCGPGNVSWLVPVSLGFLAAIAVALLAFRHRPSASTPESEPDVGGGPSLPDDGSVAPAAATMPGASGALRSEPPARGPSPDAGDEAPLADQILVHLYRLGRPPLDRSFPAGFSQGGMAAALGRPQGAFARTLLRLESAGLVTVEVAHVEGARRRLKVYRLTSQGASAARRSMGPGAAGGRGNGDEPHMSA